MKKEQEREWKKAQNIELSVDLVSIAKKQLQFIAAIHQNRYLHGGPTLQWAVYRYNALWIPLLDKHLKNPVLEDPLVVPLDCEWIWHCHRLNPVRYKSDCEKLYGRVLGNDGIISSIHGSSTNKSKETWKDLYPHEPYELEYNNSFIGNALENVQSEKFTSYDLVSAVKRQVYFNYQVSRPHVSDDMFLEEALERYKGFLYLVKIIGKPNEFFVPTYDIDLMWHSHQLHPISYCNDLCKIIGKVMEHDDTATDRTKGSALDTNFSGTTIKWEDTFGLRYWKAGAMNIGSIPIPVTQIPSSYIYEGRKIYHASKNYDNLIQSIDAKSIEVLLEFVEIKNIPESHKGGYYVSFTKRHPDKLFNEKRTLPISSESRKKHVAIFQCEPRGEILFDLLCHSQLNVPLSTSFKVLGSCSLSLQECATFYHQLSIDKWVPVVPIPEIPTSNPILLHVSLSFTPPTPAPHIFHLRWSQHILNDIFSFPPSSVGKVDNTKSRTFVTNKNGNNVHILQMRELSNGKTRSSSDSLKEVQYITCAGETYTLAKFERNEWSIKGITLKKKLGNDDGYLFELVGDRLVRLFVGRNLEYQQKYYENKRSEHDFMTAVEFSNEYPYGKAFALIDFKHGILEVKDRWMILTSITLAFILRDVLRRNGDFGAKEDLEHNTPNHISLFGTLEAEVVDDKSVLAMLDIFKSGGYRSGYGDLCKGGGDCGLECGLMAGCKTCSGGCRVTCANCMSRDGGDGFLVE